MIFKVLHCLETISSGGVEQRRLLIAQSLGLSNIRHKIICSSAHGPIAEKLRLAGVELIEVGAVESIYNWQRYRVAARIVDDWQPDIIHGAVIEGYTLASIVGSWKRIPVIMEETSDPQSRRWKGHLLARAMAGLADHCVGVSPNVGRYLTETLHIPKRKVSVISNGVEQPACPDNARLQTLQADYGIETGDLVVGSVGRAFNEHKRFSDLIRAIRLLKDIFSLKLLIVGDGPDLPMLRDLAKQEGVDDLVIFAGYQPEPGHFYALMDVFALASAREAFGLVNAEAMRCSLPVVATRVGGIPDVVVDGETGILVPPDDVKALADGLRRLLTDASLRQQMGEAGKARADLEFSSERYVEEVRCLYERVAKPKSVEYDERA